VDSQFPRSIDIGATVTGLDPNLLRCFSGYATLLLCFSGVCCVVARSCLLDIKKRFAGCLRQQGDPELLFNCAGSYVAMYSSGQKLDIVLYML
jgi:hypothetical protein